MDEKGYFVQEDYSSYEECDAPPISQMVKKDPIKKTAINLASTNGRKCVKEVSKAKVAAPGAKSQASLSAFFKK